MIVDGTWDTQKFTDAMGNERGRLRAAVLEHADQGRRRVPR